MQTLALDDDGDLALENGDFVMLEGSYAVRQAIRSRFRFFLGEWFLDQREGVPYYRDILVKNPDPDVVRSVFRQVLLTTPGVLEIRRFDLKYDAPSRTLTFTFEVQSTDGPIVVNEDDDFIVKV